jgi:hypothetical protein
VSTGISVRVPDVESLDRERILRFAAIAFFGVLPVLAVCLVFASSIADTTYAIDFAQFYRGGENVLAGHHLYPANDAPLTAWSHPYPYVYPPLPALVAAPVTVVPLQVAGVFLMGVLVLVVLLILRVLDVRDWRCYGLVLLWPPVISAIQTANPTLWLALATALAWRYRDRPVVAPIAIGVTFAVKFVLWPLLVWFAATRRLLGAIIAVLVGMALLLVSWSVIGFEGFFGYPDLLDRLDRTVGADSYSVKNLALDYGASSGLAELTWVGVGVALLVACILVARGGDERSAFVLALIACLALSPLVWLHYFTFLVVVVAIARPRLCLVWFLPLPMFFATGTGHPTSTQVALTLATAALTAAAALRETRRVVHGTPRVVAGVPAS